MIANRGEIALRALQAAQALDWEAVLFCTPVDRLTKAFRFAREHFICEESHPQESYLNLKLIRRALTETGCDFLYPGYGFLSENPGLPRLCDELGVRFIGPREDLLSFMSDKLQADQFAKDCGVPTLKIASLEQISSFPVLLKAARGGGGRGNLIVNSKNDLQSEFEKLRKRSLELFHDDKVLIERYLPRARHVELQVFGLGPGQVEILGTRDCSVQRRFQKIIEEGEVSDEIRAAIRPFESAICQKLGERGYLGAGTLEFLWDLDGKSLYFLEMNSRIQVEHTVTESLITQNLVECQLRAAAGSLDPTIFKGPIRGGHAFQFRIYAEDCDQAFLPDTGVVECTVWPQILNCRWDLALEPSDEITGNYDPMIAKLIVWEVTREKAIATSIQALRQTVVHGVKTNLDFLIEILETPDFQQDDVSISWLESHFMNNRSARVGASHQQSRARELAEQVFAPPKSSRASVNEGKLWRISHRRS